MLILYLFGTLTQFDNFRLGNIESLRIVTQFDNFRVWKIKGIWAVTQFNYARTVTTKRPVLGALGSSGQLCGDMGSSGN